MLTPEPPPWPAIFARRITECRAMRVTRENVRQAAVFCGGTTWADSVVVPIITQGRPGEDVACEGDWIVEAGRAFSVWQHGRFTSEWRSA